MANSCVPPLSTPRFILNLLSSTVSKSPKTFSSSMVPDKRVKVLFKFEPQSNLPLRIYSLPYEASF